MPALDAAPHHDGSELYVPEPPQALGDTVTVLLRVPRAMRVDEVAVRYVEDGEPRVAPARADGERQGEVWWRASFPVWNPATPYRWLLAGGDLGYAWLNGAGLQLVDVPDADDFVLAPGGDGPAWHLESVVYEVFLDRFARSGEAREAPAWAVPRSWEELPTGRGPETPFEWFGGDLRGIEARLDHVERLGANVLYLTPFFPAGSTHRYDAHSFERVDPLLGGDDALRSLVRAAHARGIRVLGDLTTNHVGDGHPWFAAARAGRDPERGFFFFDERLEHGYEAWYGVPSLPKLDYRSSELRARMYEASEAVVRRWLREPYALDGWRIDVANMTGRRRELDLAVEVSRGLVAAAREARPDALVLAEHAHDAREDLRRGAWHGTMGYAGFTRPVWAWLRGDALPQGTGGFVGLPAGIPRLPAQAVVETMRRFRAGVPWPRALHSWTILSSHDTARFRTVAGSRERQRVGVGLQMTSPGVPMVFAGDEIGLEGAWGEDARRPFPWDESRWDGELLAWYRALAVLRRSSPALRRGGIRYAHVSADAIAYLRESPEERVLCLATRAEHAPVRLPLAALGATALEPLVGGEAALEGGEAVLPADGPAFHAWRVT